MAVGLGLCRSVWKITSSASDSSDSAAMRSLPLGRLTAHAFEDWVPKCSTYFIGILAHVAYRRIPLIRLKRTPRGADFLTDIAGQLLAQRPVGVPGKLL
jgi:hypothetical protein